MFFIVPFYCLYESWSLVGFIVPLYWPYIRVELHTSASTVTISKSQLSEDKANKGIVSMSEVLEDIEYRDQSTSLPGSLEPSTFLPGLQMRHKINSFFFQLNSTRWLHCDLLFFAQRAHQLLFPSFLTHNWELNKPHRSKTWRRLGSFEIIWILLE